MQQQENIFLTVEYVFSNTQSLTMQEIVTAVRELLAVEVRKEMILCSTFTIQYDAGTQVFPLPSCY